MLTIAMLLMMPAALMQSTYAQNIASEQQTKPMIHGREVSTECLTAYKGLFAPEHERVNALRAIMALVTSPAELAKRAQSAAEAMTAYQAALDIVDAKLADSLTMEDKSNLENASSAQQDVGPTLNAIAKMVEDPGYQGSPELKTAFAAFKHSRELELKAAAVVDTACPDDLE